MRNVRCLVAFAVVLLGCGRGENDASPAAGDDAQEIQGTWKAVSMVVEGQRDAAPELTLVIGGGKITPFVGNDADATGEYRLDSDRIPENHRHDSSERWGAERDLLLVRR